MNRDTLVQPTLHALKKDSGYLFDDLGPGHPLNQSYLTCSRWRTSHSLLSRTGLWRADEASQLPGRTIEPSSFLVGVGMAAWHDR